MSGNSVRQFSVNHFIANIYIPSLPKKGEQKQFGYKKIGFFVSGGGGLPP